MQWNDLIGAHVGPYEIIEELGRGGSARVYKAYQAAMHRYVAIKVLANDSEDQVGFVRRFAREVEVVAQLNHPNIVAVYDSGEVEDLVYLVMQCVNGGTFRQRLGQPLAVATACGAAHQVARALQHAHSRGIIHRDVKPSNMLIDSEDNNRILLTDFGIAKLQGMRGLTKSGTTIGTPEYMAPEQAEGREIDGRADVYSLGCVLYEALAGRSPFVGSTAVSVLYQQVHARPDYIRALNPQVPRELARVLEMALAKRPEDRFDSAEGFAYALQQFTGGDEGGSDIIPPRGATAPRWGASTDLGAGGTGQASAGRIPELGLDKSGVAGFAGAPVMGPGLRGLGALFPDDPEAHAARSAQGPAGRFDAGRRSGATRPGGVRGSRLPPSGATPPPGAPDSGAGPRPTIPLKAFNLPARDTMTPPLSLPLSPSGQLDLDALMTDVDEIPTITMPPVQSAEAAQGTPPEALALAHGRERLPGASHEDGRDGWPPAEVPPKSNGSPGSPTPVWRPDVRDLAPNRSRRLPLRGKGLALVAALVAVALLAVGTLTWIGAHRVSADLRTHPVAHPTATATTIPTMTPTAVSSPTPAATATPTQQQLADAQAAAAFRAISVSPNADGARANNTTTFTSSQSIHVNLCIAQSAPSGAFSIVVRQGGTTVLTLARNQSALPNHWYSYLTYSLAAGSYDVLVTFNGGTAADLLITVS